MTAVNKSIVKNWNKYKRDYLWRHKITSYKIMIAEFMLQRTKAKQVEPVYRKFISKYPDMFKLSKARERSASVFTNGIGLHKRGANFTKAAKYVVSHHKGKLPKEREELLKIPGIGDYVAGAILTVCFNKPEHVIDSNIARFINRFYGFELKGEIRRKKQVIEKAKVLFNYPETRNLLFALLDFTALICKPLKPDCANCIFFKYCGFQLKEGDGQT